MARASNIIIFVTLFTSACKLSKPLAETLPKDDAKPGVIVPYYSLHDSSALNILINAIGESQIVLLGEASHGTSEFQDWRARITKRLIDEKGFRFIVMEADFNEMLSINNFVKGNRQDNDSAIKLLSVFKRWPTWMWANREFADFVTWLKVFNQSTEQKEKVSVYGFDIYGVSASLDSFRIVERNPAIIEALKSAEQCYKPYWNDVLRYSTNVHDRASDCSGPMEELRKKESNFINKKINSEEDFISLQHLLTALDGERYFRTLAQNQSAAWNIRDRHMMAFIERLRTLYGRHIKIIVWAHNSHVGNAMFTDMPQRGKTNLGELLKRAYGDNEVFSVGFGMYAGEVVAAYKWSDSAHIIPLPAAYEGTWEELLHHAGEGDKLIMSNEVQKIIPLNRWYNQRAIGVLYHPDRVRSSYIPSYVSKRYDAFIFIDSTHAIHVVGAPKVSSLEKDGTLQVD